MATVFDLVGEIKLDGIDDVQKSLKGLQGKVEDFTAGFKKAGLGMMAVGGGITAALATTVKAANDERVGINRLSQQLKNVNVNYKEVENTLESLISTTQQKTGIADDQQRIALGDLVTVTGDYKQALDLLPLALDLAAAKEMDVSAAAELVGKVAAGNTSVLTRYGIVLQEGATASEALAVLQQKVGGTAEAAKNPIELLKNNLSDLSETIGGALLGDVDKFIAKLNEIIIGATDWIKKNPELVRTLGAVGIALIGAGGVLFAISQVSKAIIAINTALAIMQALSGPKGWITLAAGLAIAAGSIVGINALMNQGTSNVPSLASGGIAMSPTLAMVGDNPAGEAIIPLNQLSGGGLTVNQYIQGSVWTQNELDNHIHEALLKYGNRNTTTGL